MVIAHQTTAPLLSFWLEFLITTVVPMTCFYLIAEVHSGNPSDKNPFHLLLDYYRANEMKCSQVCFQGPTFSVLILLVQKLRIPLVKVSDILAPSRNHEIQVSSQNPTKLTKTCKIPQNLQEILSNTCWYNIFETYLDYLGCLNAISYYK